MLGDWGGTRTELLEKGYDFTLGYTGEMGSNLHGGYDHDRTARYSDQFTFGTHWTCRRSSAGTTPNSS
jgi:porin